ncbi:Gpb1p [Lachancea thermotolerans CBS 6340]|uniref:KLTH0D00748p n=1 Tax=Lachancea thermotolerans (strain ATCC 56472 / CBS 6340 / NRRL Y-8284) TaxID=559295 RepID=C5DFX6_LACTC|nr:KLTH0D00748p [Lachancea thermotolerans CBS 6340]CAR22318.1 KLTH0D00748p [Lachancea thermotolerans CBS 6340]
MQSGVSSFSGSSDNSQLSLNLQNNAPVAGNYGVPVWTKDHYKSQYKAPPYLSNYVPGLRDASAQVSAERRKLDNEKALIAYYSSKIHVSRHDSIISGCSNPSVGSDNSRRSARMKHALKSTHKTFGDHGSPLRCAHDESKYSPEVFSKGYLNYCSKLPLPVLESTKLLKRHNMWIPMTRWDIRDKNSESEGPSLSHHDGNKEEDSRLFTDVKIHPADYPSNQNTFVGSMTIPPLFGEMKLPPFAYQCTVDLDDNIYTLGGLTSSYLYSDEAPDLSSFHVDGVPNLPPPLLDNVVNNPCMVNNHDLYVISSSSSRVQKPTTTGQVPPPLLCMTGSVLTKRHIFYYGGFEIKTETTVDEQTGKFFLKKRAYLHNTAYILDVVTFKFTKVELVAQPTKFNAYPATVPRFGHAQVSVQLSPTTTLKCAACSASSSSESKTDESKPENIGASSPISQPLDLRSQSETSLTAEKVINTKLSNSLNSGVFTVIVMGGYRQINEDEYETLNDLWKLEVTVTARGKRNYFKFADTALATPFARVLNEHEGGTWPGARAFQACEVYDTELLKTYSSKPKLLENLRANFCIEPETLSPGVMSPGEKAPSLTRRSELYENHHIHAYGDSTCSGAWNHKSNANTQFTGKTLLVHGGSDKEHVYGDMWWFDLDNEEWTLVPTYVKRTDSKCHSNEVQLPLVGHTLVRIASNAVLTGGLSQEDVDKLWSRNKTQSDPNPALPPSLTGALHLLDLSSLVLKPFLLGTDPNEIQRARNIGWPEVLRFICAPGMHKNGFVYLVGGMMFNISKVEELYLRGTMTVFILPIITTPKVVTI